MSTLRVNNITDTSGGSSNLSVPGAAEAWVNFNGTGTVAIRAQMNVSSITDNGVGDYTVNFTTALADANYTPIMGCTMLNSSYNSVSYNVYPSSGSTVPFTKTTSALRTLIIMGVFAGASATAAVADSAECNVAVFR